MKIGVVDLDTSHPQNWIPIERDLGHDVACLWDGGTIHPAGYADTFAEEHKVAEVCKSLEEMVEKVDCAIIHSCNWDSHLDNAKPFVDAGKGVLIDKPLAGNLKELSQLQAWSEGGARVTGGSSLRFCNEVRDWLAIPVDERGTPDTVVCGCAVDDYNYGIHAYSMLYAIMGTGAISVQHLSKGVQRRIRVNWPDGRMGMLIIDTAEAWMPFYAQITTEKKAYQIQADSKGLYRALLENTLPYLAGDTDTAPIGFPDLSEPERCALAAKQSWENGDAEIRLDDLSESDPGYDGGAFAVAYKKQRYPETS
jgi:hypothetical protein